MMVMAIVMMVMAMVMMVMVIVMVVTAIIIPSGSMTLHHLVDGKHHTFGLVMSTLLTMKD